MFGLSFFINADGRGAERTINSVKSKVGGLSNSINSGLKGKLAGAFSVAAIGYGIKSMIDFGDATLDASANLGITIEDFQALKLAAREVGKDVDIFGKIFDGMASKIESGNEDAMESFKKLGLTIQDLQDMDKVSLMTKAVAGTKGMARGEAESHLRNIGAGKSTSTLMGLQGQLGNFGGFKDEMKSQGRMASDEDMAALAELNDQWDSIVDTIKAEVAPILVWLIDTFKNFGKGVGQLTEFIATAMGALVGSITKIDIKGAFIAYGESVKTAMTNLFDNIIAVVTGKMSVSDAIAGGVTDYVNGVGRVLKDGLGIELDSVGQILQDKLLEFGERDKQENSSREARKRARLQEQEDLKNKKAGRTVGKQPEEKDVLDKSLGGGSPLLKIGGMLGTDTSYRMERLTKETNDLLRRLVRLTEEQNRGPVDPQAF